MRAAPLEHIDNLPPLSEHELEELIGYAPPGMRTAIARLCAEVKTLRDQQAAREFTAEQEVTW